MLCSPKRFFNIHEYQSKKIMGEHGVRVLKGRTATNADEAEKAALQMFEDGASGLVVKAQIHAGGRGKGYFDNGFQGGVHIVKNAQEAKEIAEKMLGAHLITKQTTSEGQPCLTVLLEPTIKFKRELYLAFLMDRSFNGPVMVASTQGGMDIENVAKRNPKAILKEGIDIDQGLLPEQTQRMAEALGFEPDEMEDAQKQMQSLYETFIEHDCTQIEINPLVVTSAEFTPPYPTVDDWAQSLGRFNKFSPCFEYTRWDELLQYNARDLIDLGIDARAAVPLAKIIQQLETNKGAGKVVSLDAKLNFDNNAEFRNKDIFALRDSSMEDPREVAAGKFDLNYIGLDGNIGCMVNGAGLAMSTMDIISLRGGSPANFLDVGGGATEEQVEAAFRILTSDDNVKAILVNIFGGIMKCDVIAQGIVNAAKNIDINVPLVVRLEGTNIEKGKEILRNSPIDVIAADDLDQAAQLAVQEIAKINRSRAYNIATKSTSKKKILAPTAFTAEYETE